MNPTKSLDDSAFEGYRRDRKRRHLASGPKRDLGRNANVLRELELAEEEEMRDEQMNREVNDFFSDATRTAAEIVARVAKAEEQSLDGSVTVDMTEFLNGTITRAQSLIESLRQQASLADVSSTDIEPMVHNIVGQQLDDFRNQGTANLADKHIGQDPFSTDLESLDGPAEPAFGDEVIRDEAVRAEAFRDEDFPEDEASHNAAIPAVAMHEHLAATGVEEERARAIEESAPKDHVFGWMSGLRDDSRRLADTLRLLVANRLMTKDEAIGVYRELK